MNNSYSSPEKYLERWITPSLQHASRDHAAVVLTGARQVGKSTLLPNAEPFRNWRYHSMDEFDVLDQARQDPEALWAGTDRVILDEVQKPRIYWWPSNGRLTATQGNTTSYYQDWRTFSS